MVSDSYFIIMIQWHRGNHIVKIRWSYDCLIFTKGFLKLGPVSLTIFARNSNSMESLPCCNSVIAHQIATNFCTCHDSTAVVTCTKFCGDHCIRIEVKANRNSHRIWIAMEKTLVKRDPGKIAFLNWNLPWYIFSKKLQANSNFAALCFWEGPHSTPTSWDGFPSYGHHTKEIFKWKYVGYVVVIVDI